MKTLKGPPQPGKSFAYQPIILNYLKIWISDKVYLQYDTKNYLEGKNQLIAIRENKSHYNIRTEDLHVGSFRQHPMHHRDRDQLLAA